MMIDYVGIEKMSFYCNDCSVVVGDLLHFYWHSNLISDVVLEVIKIEPDLTCEGRLYVTAIKKRKNHD